MRSSTGQPIYPSLVDTVTLTVHLSGSWVRPSPTTYTGPSPCEALILSQANTWQESSTVKGAVGV